MLATGVDWIALSFIQRPEDLAEARKIARGRAALLSKIEKPQAVTRLAEIIELSDALMVARGDLGVEMPIESVPGIQKQITRAARRAGKPVVVATQMLESMISAPVPTRAEVSDVATAVYEGADAIMLSAESAAGQYPVEAVSMMNAIAEQVERDPTYPGIINAQRSEPEATGADAISAAARQIAETLKLSAIITYTASGTTGLRAARERPHVPIIALSPVVETARRLSLVWGTALRGDSRCHRSRRHGRPCLPHHFRGTFRQARRSGDRHGGRTAADAGRHQHAAYRLYRFRRSRRTLVAAHSRRAKRLRFRIHAAIDRSMRVGRDARLDTACRRLQIDIFPAKLLDGADSEIGSDPV